MAKIKITNTPTKSIGRGVKITGVPIQGGYNQTAPTFYGQLGAPAFETSKSLKSVDREDANIEAEKGETALFPNKAGLPAHFNIGGNRHTGGGTPLNVPKDTFIFSDTKKMRIKDPEVLAEFGKAKGSYTPAELAKKYDINKYRKLLQDPNSDSLEISTAEKMIANYNLKLGKLALVQESKKGFPQGIPVVAMPYLATFNISADSVLPLKAEQEGPQEDAQEQEEEPGEMPMGQYGMSVGINMRDTNNENMYSHYAQKMANRMEYTPYQEVSHAQPVEQPKDSLHPAIKHWMDKGYDRDQALKITGKRYGGTLPGYDVGGTHTATEEENKKAAEVGTPKGTTKNYGITVHKGDTLESIDPVTKKKGKTWNAARIAQSDAELNELAYELGFDPSKFEGKDINEKFQRFLYTVPEFKDEIDKAHSTDQYGTPQVTGKMFDGKLGVRWIDAITKAKKNKPAAKVEGKPKIDTTPIKTAEVGPYTRGRQDAPYWLQDIVNTASAAGTRLGLHKYLPWAPKMEPHTPRGTFYDPTRELAANAEQMAIGTQGAGMFAGPQAYNARFSQIQGAGAKNAANVLSNYHNKNVQVANEFENLRTGIYNKADQLNAGVASKLYDQTTIANQQFDNAKRQANNELRDSYVNAVTNRAQTQTMNAMYPNFQVNPLSGGMLDFYKGSDIKPQDAATYADTAQKVRNLMESGLSEDAALKILGYNSDKNASANINQNVALNQYMQQMQRYGSGPQYGNHSQDDEG